MAEKSKEGAIKDQTESHSSLKSFQQIQKAFKITILGSVVSVS